MDSTKRAVLLICFVMQMTVCSAAGLNDTTDVDSIIAWIMNATNTTDDIEINRTVSDTTATLDMDETSTMAVEGNDSWTDGGCVNVTDFDTVRINVTGSTPTRVGHWMLVRWGFFGADWMCDLRGTRRLIPVATDLIDTLQVNVGSKGVMEVGHTKMRCEAIKSKPCLAARWPRRRCDAGDSVDYCFRLRIRCDGAKLAEAEIEKEQLRGQKWIMFGYGALSGFVIGCIVASIAMMCIDSCCDEPKTSGRKMAKRTADDGMM